MFVNEEDDVEDEGFDEDLFIRGLSSATTTPPQKTTTAIKGPNGSLRGKRNSVKNCVENYKELVKQANEEKANFVRNYEKEEQNKCVLYITSCGIIRETFENCRKLKAILSQHLIRFDLRDIYINQEFKRELKQRINSLDVPQMFLNGKQLGSNELIERLNEQGQLLTLLSAHRMTSYTSHTCTCCGGSKFIPCMTCNGSRKSQIHHFIEDSITLKCSVCKYTGIVSCPQC